ncbi:MAG: glutathione transferase [Enterobacteriaceae bacterium]|nr:glutathione transferase [Enterobacteriaceae bacterium]
MLKGLNHLTLAVVDLRRSVDFYQRLLGLELHAQWDNGAYFSCGDLWLCLSVDAARQQAGRNGILEREQERRRLLLFSRSRWTPTGDPRGRLSPAPFAFHALYLFIS